MAVPRPNSKHESKFKLKSESKVGGEVKFRSASKVKVKVKARGEVKFKSFMSCLAAWYEPSLPPGPRRSPLAAGASRTQSPPRRPE